MSSVGISLSVSCLGFSQLLKYVGYIFYQIGEIFSHISLATFLSHTLLLLSFQDSDNKTLDFCYSPTGSLNCSFHSIYLLCARQIE